MTTTFPKIIFISLIILLFTQCAEEECEQKPYDCSCKIKEFSGVREILDSLKIAEDDFDQCQYIIEEKPEFLLRGQTERKANGYFYNDSLLVTSLTKHKLYFYDKYQGKFDFEIIIYDFKDQEEFKKFDEFKKSISRSLYRSKEQHTFVVKDGYHIMYYEGFP